MRTCDALHERFGAPYPTPGDLAREESHCDNGFSLRGDAALHTMLVATSRLKRALLRGATEILDAAGLTVSQWLILRHLCQVDAATLTEVATAIRHDIGALSRSAHFLQQRRLVTAMRMPSDRRTVRLSISQPGKELCGTLGTRLGEHQSQTLDIALGQQATRALLQLMERAAASLDQNVVDKATSGTPSPRR